MTSLMTVAEFVAKHNVTMFVEAVDSVPHRDMDDDWNRTASHWRCLLRHDGKRMTVYFSQGSAHTKPPTVEDVLDSVSQDSRGVEEQSFREWASEFDYSTDSIKALRIFKACQKYARKLRALLGDAPFAELLDCESL